MHLVKPRILVVDDEPGVLLTTTAILTQEGYDVLSSGGGAAALDAIHQRHYDLVLTDLKMPVVDGLAVLAEVRKYSPDTVTVMMTGYGSVDSALEAVRLGAYEYLLKPTAVEDLKAAVRRSLERKRLSEIDTLYRITHALSATVAPDGIKTAVSEAVRAVLGIASVSLLTLARDGELGLVSDALHATVQHHEVLSHLQNAVVTADDAPAVAKDWAVQAGIRSFAFVPGMAGERLVCVLGAHNGASPFEFHPSALRFLQGVAHQSALALENASLIAVLQKNNDELEAANRKLQELDQLKSQFLSVATHELRTPLSIILGYNAMLAESLENRLSAEEHESLRESVAACKRLIRLVNSMLDLSQIQTGKMKMNFELADVRTTISAVVALFQQQARQKGLSLSVELPVRLPRVLLDTERFEQVLVNLLGNALKFTPAGCIRVGVRSHTEPPAIEITVRDTGVGIAPDEQAKIFDEFAQVRHQAAHRQREGSGLGLAIAKRIVEAHEGQISVSSTPGKGSTFTVTLPLRKRRPSPRNAVSA